VGGWLELPDVIQRFYVDQINQAVGRNTGFRKSKKPTKTMLISSSRLARGILAECFQHSSARIRLVRTKAKSEQSHLPVKRSSRVGTVRAVTLTARA
jgi:hypothetical protein